MSQTRLLRAFRFLLSACLLLSAACATAADTPVSLTGTVTWVYDADTLEIVPHGKVRLLGIDAPEKDPSPRDRSFTGLGILPGRLRPGHEAGIAYGIKQVKGQTVALAREEPARDRHGRLLAYVYLPDGRLLNRVLLEEGLVIVYRRFDFARKDEFLAVEAQARARGTGLWKR